MNDAWVTAVKEVGFPIAAYGGLAFAVWAVIKWVGGNLVTPFRDRAFRFIDRLEGNVDSMSANLREQTTTLRDINDNQADIKISLLKIADNGCGGRLSNGVHKGGDCGKERT